MNNKYDEALKHFDDAENGRSININRETYSRADWLSHHLPEITQALKLAALFEEHKDAFRELVDAGVLIDWQIGFPDENCMCLVELDDGENIVTPYTHTAGRDTWGDKRKTGWSCLTGSHTRVKKWVKTKNFQSVNTRQILKALLGEMSDD